VTVAACYRGGVPEPPQPPPPRAARSVSADPLAYLPADSELVAVIDVRTLRDSVAWQRLEQAMLAKAGSVVDQLRSTCEIDPLARLRRISLGLRDLDAARPRGVIVARGIDRTAMMGCVRPGAGITVERGFVTVAAADAEGERAVFTFVDETTLVMLIEPEASTVDLDDAIRAGSPLRIVSAVREVLATVRTRDPLWFAVVGAPSTLGKLALLGSTPRAMFGSLRLGHGAEAELRLRLGTPDEATNMASLIQGQIGAATAMFEELAVTAEELDFVLRMKLTPSQLDSMIPLIAPP
jgi:hypothetical protein